jgi:hypothetical protein
LSDEFCDRKGSFQGCPMSPTLFKIFIDAALKNGLGNVKEWD